MNQQLRWGQGIRAARTLITKGWIGQVTDASIQVSVNTPWDMWGWLVISPRLEILYHSIHYIDAMRSLDIVFGIGPAGERQNGNGPLRAFIGTEGVITGTLGAMYNYPHGRPDTLEWSSHKYYPDKRFEAKLEGQWIPDAFIGPTASLMQAIQEDGIPETDGADNLQTLRVVEAAYLSAAENRCHLEVTTGIGVGRASANGPTCCNETTF